MGRTRRSPESPPTRTGRRAGTTRRMLRRRTVSRLAEVAGKIDIIDLLG